MATQQSQWLFLSSLFLLSLSALSSPPKIYYADHCKSVVPLSTPRSNLIDSSISFQLSGRFSGGDELFGQDTAQGQLPRPAPYVYFYADPESLHETRARGVIQLDGSLNFEGPITPHHGRKRASFALSGLWDESTGDLCMVGSNWAALNAEICPLGSGCRKREDQGTSLVRSVVFKLNYPKASNLTTSLVSGTLRSLDSVDSRCYFDPISILSYAQMSYSYTTASQVIDSCNAAVVPKESLGIEGADPCAHLYSLLHGQFRLENTNTDVSGRTFGPFSDTAFVGFNQVRCSDQGRVHMYAGFSNASGFGHSNEMSMMPGKSLVGEGFWDPEKKTICLVACPIISMNGSIGDCSIGLSFWIPAVFSLRRRTAAFGHIWSNKERGDPGHFEMVSLRSLSAVQLVLPGWRYEYTELDAVKRSSCSNDDGPGFGNKIYPNGNTLDDMRFDVALKDVQGNAMWGFAAPLASGDTNDYHPNSVPMLQGRNQSSWNVSYRLQYTFVNSSLNLQQSKEIAAEGMYNAATGKLCMVGCQHPSTLVAADDAAADCEVLIDIQFPPTNPEDGEYLTGRIISTRNKSDRLYFEPLEVSSSKLYKKQAMESIWRMDIEIAMVLLSLTLSCVCIMSQLLYVKRHEEAPPSMSVTMLAILTVGYIIPLVLNFKALFMMNRNKRNVLLWSGGWIEASEIIVRSMTMVVFLLQFRLLQRAWSNVRSNGLWIAELQVLKLCVPLYFAGAVVAWFVHWRSYESHQMREYDFNSRHPHSLWEDLISYSGLILDGFLLPQAVLNAVANSKGKALSPLFYIGTAAVRAMPHVYDAYRAQHYFPRFSSSSYIYASQDGELYSSAWDVIVPLQGFLLALLVCLQQRFGGRCLLPQKRVTAGGYEMVHVSSGL